VSAIGDEFLALAKLQARDLGRAVLISRVMRVDPDLDAFILAPIKMTGEGRLWAAAFGRRGEDPRFVCAADARHRDDENTLVIEPIAKALDEYFRDCLLRERAPQIWVSSRAAVTFLDGLSDRRVSRDPGVALLGLRLHFPTDRYFYAGQQVLLPAVEALSQHFATGQSSMEDQHLGAFLAWIDPPPDTLAEHAARVAEESPAGVVTDVDMDFEVSESLTELARLHREDRNPRRRREIGQFVASMLGPVAKGIHDLIERGIDVLERQGLTLVPAIEKLRKADSEAFSFYMTRDFVPLRSSADYAARQLADRENAIDRAVSTFLGHDLTEMALALESGELLEGTITEFVYGSRQGSVHEVVLETDQILSTLRLGDTVRIHALRNIVLQLVDQGPPNDAGSRVLRFKVDSGKTFLEDLLYEDVTLLPASGGYSAMYRNAPHVPWILGRDASMPETAGRRVPEDPEAALEVLT
jgi:hypothetical protein